MDEHPQFTDDEVRKLKAMTQDWDRTRWLGRLVWHMLVLIGSAVAALAVFKEHLLSLFSKH